jgi:hypothetical protein
MHKNERLLTFGPNFEFCARAWLSSLPLACVRSWNSVIVIAHLVISCLDQLVIERARSMICNPRAHPLCARFVAERLCAQANIFEEWRAHYLRYKPLKRMCKKMFEQVRSQSSVVYCCCC